MVNPIYNPPTDAALESTIVPASGYSFDELATLYNNARVDYIVPMPMNARRMAEYVRDYDVDLSASAVMLNNTAEPIGVAMLGLRDERSWITRLGVLPASRGHKAGLRLMEYLLSRSVERGACISQLEVIHGNEPAQQLFLKLGFKVVRDLRVVRRPPGKPETCPVAIQRVEVLNPEEVAAALESRSDEASWIEETPSLIHAGKLNGLRVVLESGAEGWIVYQCTSFQLGHFVLHVPQYEMCDVTHALLHSVHEHHSMQDTKVENLPASDPCWPAFLAMGYLEAFQRVEMLLDL